MTPSDRHWLAKAAQVAKFSRDPSTQTGCVLVLNDGLIGAGYNAYPDGLARTPERDADRATRLAYTVHAEIGALLCRTKSTHGATAYMHPWPPCADCAKTMIAAGIKRVVSPAPTPAQVDRWGESFTLMASMFNEAGVKLDLIHKED